MNEAFHKLIFTRRAIRWSTGLISCRKSWIVAGLCFFSFLPGLAHGQTADMGKPVVVRNLWPQDTTIEALPPTQVIVPGYVELWLEAINHHETDLRQAMIAQLENIHRAGFDQTEIAGQIRGQVKDDNHHTVNMALASLLVSLDDRESAAALFRLIKPGHVEIAQIVEPALARWNFEPAKPVWKERLSNEKTRRTLLVLAIDCLRVIKDESAASDLLEIAMDQTTKPSIRLPAARAVGAIRSTGLEDQAVELNTLKSKQGVVNRLCSIAFLSNHQSDASVQFLQKLMLDEVGAVAGAAWQRVLEIDSAQAVPYAKQCLSNDDPLVRQSVITALFEQPTLERIDMLGQLLTDRHPEIRISARFALRRLANQNQAFDDRVRTVGMKVINDRSTTDQGLEEALILLTALAHQDVAGRAVELLSHAHPKVMVTAAWALRNLRVEGTFEKMFEHATAVSNRLLEESRDEEASLSMHQLDQIAHLFDSFGETEFRDAEALMRRFVPKNVALMSNCRPAAITALGKLHRGDPDAELVRLFVQRMNDQISEPGESSEVWAACAIALGRMNANSEVGQLKKYYSGEPVKSGLNYSAAWSLRELTGEEFMPPQSEILHITGFDLEPKGPRFREAEEARDSARN